VLCHAPKLAEPAGSNKMALAGRLRTIGPGSGRYLRQTGTLLNEMGKAGVHTRQKGLDLATNKLIWGDNKFILSSLKSGALRRQIEEAGGLKLIYIDPPFDVGADFSMDIEICGETFHKEPNLLEQIAYRDTWGRGADSFISMIYERLILMR